LKAWIEELGYTPPKWVVSPAEAEDKGWEQEVHHAAVAKNTPE
jgi:hypothetical protein